MRWNRAVKAPTVARKLCRYGCGLEVDTFIDEIGLRQQLETEPVPVTADTDGAARDYRLWEYGGRRVGWYLRHCGHRNWRELRLAHQCENTPKREQQGERKHEKVNEQ